MSTHDSAKPDSTFRIAAPGQDCLEGAFTVFEKYFSAASSPRDVADAWDCAAKAVDSFATRSRGGSNVSSFSPNELRTFLHESFLGSTKISDPLLREGMRLKQMLLGGEIDRLSREELKRAKDVLAILKSVSLRLQPHVAMLTLDARLDEVRAKEPSFEAALRDFRSAADEVTGLFRASKEPFELAHFEIALRELDAIYSTKSGWKGPARLLERFGTFKIVKALLVRPEGDRVRPDEWKPLLSASSRLYTLYLRLHYFMRERDLLNGAGFLHLRQAIEEGFDLIDEAVAMKPDGLIRYELIDPAIDEVFRLKFITWKIRPSTIRELARVVLGRVLNQPSSEKGVLERKSVEGLDAELAKRGREAIMGWLDMQRLWEELESQAARKNPAVARTGSIPLPLVREIWPRLSTPYKTNYRYMSHVLIERKHPVVFTSVGSIVFERDPEKLSIDQATFDSLNWRAAFGRAVVEGYAKDPRESMFTGVTIEEFHEFFLGVRNFAVDLNFIEPADMDLWKSTFTEANIFTLAGDANDRISFSEGFDLISFALSSAQTSRKIYKELAANCEALEPDVYGIPKSPAYCYRERMQASFSKHYTLLPAWVDVVSGLSNQQYAEFQRLLEIAARKTGYSDAPVESTDVDRSTMLLHYIESVYMRFDKVRTGTIDLEEARDVYPLFKALLKQLSGYDDDETLFAIFVYVLKYRQPPSSLTDKIWFKFIWMPNTSLWTIDVDRLQLLDIIGKLKDAAP